MKTFVLKKNPFIDLSYTGEWKFGRQVWKDKQHFTEYYFGPFLLRYFHESLVTDRSSVR